MELTMKRERLGCCERVFEYCAPAEEAVETVVPDTMARRGARPLRRGHGHNPLQGGTGGAGERHGGRGGDRALLPGGGGAARRVSAAVPFSLSWTRRE